MEILKGWKDKIANKSTSDSGSTTKGSIASIVPDLSQLDKYNIIKRLGILEDRLNNTGDQLMKDLTYIQISAQNLARTIAAGTLEISTSVQNIAKVIGSTSIDLASKAGSLGQEFLDSANRINKPAQYVKGQFEDMSNDIHKMRDDVNDLGRSFGTSGVNAIKHARDALVNLKDGLSVMTYSSDDGGPLFGQMITSFSKISAVAFQLKNSYDQFANKNSSTITKEADDIQRAADKIVNAINRFSASFVNIFTNLANNIKGLTKQ